MANTYSLIVLAIISAITYYVYSSYRANAAKSAFYQKHGCQEMKRFPQSERVLGLSATLEVWDVEKTHRVLDYFTGKLAQHGPTFSVQILRNNILLTSDPENIKTVLSTQFQDYSVEKRKIIFSPLLGNGIFVSGK
jgi:Tfp pilus assembly protein PilE